jgi:biopolymer transport protein ExbB/TolQ
MGAHRKSALPKLIDLPLIVAAALTLLYYWLVTAEPMHGTLLHRYTTEHAVEYVIVAFFMWGLVDAAFRACSFPRELLALRQDYLPAHKGAEPIDQVAVCQAYLQKRPPWMLQSRAGRRLQQALAHLREKGSADGFADYLRNLADQDHDQTQTNYGLIRFICWVTPMFGFLGTVLHFGTALGGQTAGDLGDKLPTVVAEMGTAFNTTTVALTAATTMMFCLYLCERTERGIVTAIDARTERALLNRFAVADPSLTPFLSALEAAQQTNLRAMDAAISRQLEVWSGALESLHAQVEKQQQWQSQVWVEALEKLEERFETNDAQREARLARLLENMEQQRKEARAQVKESGDQLAAVRGEMSRLAQDLTGVVQGSGDLVRLQTALSDNLRLLRESAQIDQAVHGLTAAIHLLTARNHSSGRESKAA